MVVNVLQGYTNAVVGSYRVAWSNFAGARGGIQALRGICKSISRMTGGLGEGLTTPTFSGTSLSQGGFWPILLLVRASLWIMRRPSI